MVEEGGRLCYLSRKIVDKVQELDKVWRCSRVNADIYEIETEDILTLLDFGYDVFEIEKIKKQPWTKEQKLKMFDALTEKCS